MKVVIADASCLILLTNIDRLDILASLYDDIRITGAVLEEYGLTPPEFVSVHDAIDTKRQQALALVLDPGEASSIALAIETSDSQIIIDEKKGRRIAISLGLNVVGTLGLLMEASRRKLIDADQPLVDQLDRFGFRLSTRLKKRLLIGE